MSFKRLVIDYMVQALPPVGPQRLPARVLSAYPDKPEQLPCISVVQSAGSLESQHLGEGFEIDASTPEAPREVVHALYRQSLEITLWTTHPRERDEQSEILRLALWRMMRYLSQSRGITKMDLREAGDGQDLEGRAPVNIFSASWTVSGLVSLTATEPLKMVEDTEYAFTLTFPESSS